MERSIKEMEILCKVIPETPPFQCELKKHHSEEYGDEEYYEIPEEDKERFIKMAWPFSSSPKMDQELLDLHSNKTFKFRECLIIRFHNRNIVVSPHFFHSGGTCLDFLMNRNDNIVILFVKR